MPAEDIHLPKVHRLLVPEAEFLVFRNVFGDPSAPATPFRQRIAEVVRARESPSRPGPDAEDVEAAAVELTRTGWFAADDIMTFRWSIELDDGQVHRLFSTFSDWTVDDVNQAAAAVRELGGRVVEHYSSWLILLSPQTFPVR